LTMQGQEQYIKEKVKERYGKIALTGNSDCCCVPGECQAGGSKACKSTTCKDFYWNIISNHCGFHNIRYPAIRISSYYNKSIIEYYCNVRSNCSVCSK